jgi:hypothetical protein
LAAFRAGARFTALRAVVRLAAFRAGARLAVFLARFTAMLYALLTAFLADRFIAFLAGARPAAFLADCFAAFLAGARVVFLTGARPTTFFDARPAVLLTAFRVEFLVALLATLFVVLVVAFLGAVLAATRAGRFAAGRFAVALDDFFAGGFDTFSAGGATFPFRMSLSIPLAAKRTPRDAEMLTGAPVRGLRPMRAPRCVGLKLPNPATTTRRPDRTSFETTWTSAFTASSASRFANDVVLVTASISPDLFTAPPPEMQSQQSKKVLETKASICVIARHAERARARGHAQGLQQRNSAWRTDLHDTTAPIVGVVPTVPAHCLWTGKPVFARIFGHATAA